MSGVALGSVFPGFFQIVAGWEYASVNLVVIVLIWAMVYPMMVAIDFSGFRGTYKRPKKLVITVVVNAVVPMMAEEPVGAERLRALSQRRIEPRAA